MPSFNSKFSGGGGALVVTDLEVDSGTLSIDETNNRVGIGDTAPGTQLQLKGTAPYVTIQNSTSENTDGGCESKLIFEDHANASLGQIEVSHNGSSDDTKGKMVLSTSDGSSVLSAIEIKEGNITKLGQDSPSSSDVLTYDGAKWVAEAPAAGDITGVTAGNGLTGGGDSGAVSLAIGAGTGIDVASDEISVDVSDFMTNGSDNRVVTATGTDAMNAEANLSFDGSTLAVTGALTTSTTATIGTDLTVTGGDIAFGATNSSVTVGATAHDAAGASLTIAAGPTTAGTSNDQAGGSLTISGGQGKGSGAGGDIVFKTANAGSSGSSLNSLATALTISDDKSATFEDNVTVKGDIILDDGGSLKEAGGTAAITFDGSGNVTKIGQDSPSSGEFLKYDGAKWVSDAVATGSSAADDITTGDAAVTIATSSGNITLDAQAGDADIIFKGTDDTSDITALTLDMSDAGAALFNAGVTVGTDIIVSGGDATLGTAGNTTATTISTVTNTGTNVGKSLTISAGSTTTGANNLNGGDLILASGGGDGTGTSSIQFKTKVSGTDAAAERMRIHTDGNVGIGTNSPGNLLHMAGADAYLLLQNTTAENGEGEAETRILFGDHSGTGLAMIEASHSGTADDTKGKFIVFTHNGSSLTPAITVDDTQAAVFASTVTATGFTIGNAVISEAELEILDGASVTTTELNLLDGDTSVGGSITVADSDGFIVNDGGTMKTIPASDLKTYAGGGGTAADDSNLILHMQVFA